MATTTIKRSAGRPTREQAQHIDDIILSGAREAFCRRGIEGTSMEELALSVGVGKHTIYRRYTGKMALLDAVVTRDLDRLRQAMDEDGTGHSPLDRLRFAARRFFLFCVEPDSVRFMAFMTSESVFSEELRERFATWDRVLCDPIVACVREAQEAGELRGDEPAQSLFNLLADMLDGPSRRLQFDLPDPFGGLDADSFFEHRWSVFLKVATAR
ncbi:bacterial regulatory s, tetR family protein [Sphingomonas sp. S17]|uniref:TetR/AcrR family transcriptional regulator n=1 Tax=Sphingomonas sp. S17 TaxID=1007104 RepID=UPI00020A26A1|nr:TetR/AcrR family transcriptional regulator [Sphingomonas sp. S17]EGI56786.1 bacterial regulatory s, tetR family protein [Sphingomonas sp. S17]